MAVAAALKEVEISGDVVALNDPFAGGTHLPDVTLVSGVYLKRTRRQGRRGDGETGRWGEARTRGAQSRQSPPVSPSELPITLLTPLPVPFYVANRAHHADIEAQLEARWDWRPISMVREFQFLRFELSGWGCRCRYDAFVIGQCPREHGTPRRLRRTNWFTLNRRDSFT
jgi:hypothetical protein